MNLNTAEINGFVYGLGGCQDKLTTQVVQADPFRDSVGGVGLLWVYCRVVRPVCVPAAQAVLRTRAQILKFTRSKDLQSLLRLCKCSQ